MQVKQIKNKTLAVDEKSINPKRLEKLGINGVFIGDTFIA